MSTVMGAKEIQAYLGNLESKLKSQYLQNQIGLSAIRLVKQRTRKGISVFGKPFKKYSKAYAKKREKAGLSSSTVNLIWSQTGGMVDQLDNLVSRDFTKQIIYIKDSKKRQIARYHQIMGAGKSKVKRKWIGITKAQEKKMQMHTSKVIQQIINNLSS